MVNNVKCCSEVQHNQHCCYFTVSVSALVSTEARLKDLKAVCDDMALCQWKPQIQFYRKIWILLNTWSGLRLHGLLHQFNKTWRKSPCGTAEVLGKSIVGFGDKNLPPNVLLNFSTMCVWLDRTLWTFRFFSKLFCDISPWRVCQWQSAGKLERQGGSHLIFIYIFILTPTY